MVLIASIVALTTLVPGSTPPGVAPHRDEYTVTFGSLSSDRIDVEASVLLGDGTLQKGFGGAFEWKRGWGDYVTDLTATDERGRALEVTPVGEGEDFHWLLAHDGTPFTGEVRISYGVDLAFARTEWPFGNEQAGKFIGSDLYMVTKPLFLTSNEVDEWQVDFVVPEGFVVTTPWTHDGRAARFSGEGRLELQNNALVIGKTRPVTASVGGFEFRLHLLGTSANMTTQVSSVVQAVTKVYLEIFPDTPAHPYFMTIFPAPNNDAEAFFNSTGITTTASVAPEDKIIWANFIAHEFFHFWNGQRIRGNPRWERQWLSEGFTDYFAALALVNSGVLSEDDFLRNMEQVVGSYLFFRSSSLFDGVTLREAGKDKGRNRFGVYDGGWVAALALDREIRSATDGKRSLVDFMRALYDDFGLQERVYAYADLVETASRVAGRDMTPFFDAYVSGTEVLPVERVLKGYGLHLISQPYANRTYIVRDPADDEAEAAEFRWLTQEHFEGTGGG